MIPGVCQPPPGPPGGGIRVSGRHSPDMVIAMTTHPALQPVLKQANVTALINHLLESTTPPLRADITGPDRGIHRDGFHDGIHAAVDTIRMMWQAAVISAQATETEAHARYERMVNDMTGDGEQVNDTLGELSAIARDLLELSVRLDAADRDDVDDRAAILNGGEH